MIDKIINSDKKIYMAITGGGIGAISRLLENGGASNVFVGASVPYSEHELKTFSGTTYNNVKCCSKQMADFMANESMCMMVQPDDKKDIGVGVTASLTRGESERRDRVNHAYICVKSEEKTSHYYIVFNKDHSYSYIRRIQEDVLSRFILCTLSDFICAEFNNAQTHQTLNSSFFTFTLEEIKS